MLLPPKSISLSVGALSSVRGEISEILPLLIFNRYNCEYPFGAFKKEINPYIVYQTVTVHRKD